MNGKKKTIRIARGQEDRAIIECIYQENLFFQELYEQARNCTNEILRVNEQARVSGKTSAPRLQGRPVRHRGKIRTPSAIRLSGAKQKRNIILAPTSAI